jgi:hypothetical protein
MPIPTRLIHWIFFAVLSMPRLCSAADNTTQPVDRYAFAAAMARVRVGMAPQQVTALIGKPDDVWTKVHPNFDWYGAKEAWRYGTNGPETFPTLGQVVIDDDGKVQHVFGGEGSPPAQGMLNESDLRFLLQLIDDVPSPWHAGSDPRRLIRAVNALQPLGKDRALAAMVEYLRVSDDNSISSEGEFLILRSLFDLPPGTERFPDMHIGDISGPGIPAPTPRFPLLIVDDVPFLMAYGGGLGGTPERVEKDLPYFRDHCQIRSQPLTPTDQPLQIYDELLRQVPNWRDTDHQSILVEELLRLVETVYRPFRQSRA